MSDTFEHLTTQLPKQREMVINRPGNINYAGQRGHFPGCRIIQFAASGDVYGLEDADFKKYEEQRIADLQEPSAADAMNLYFKHRGNLLVIEQFVDKAGTIYCLFTNTLEGEELEEFQEYSNIVSQKMEEFRQKREAKKQEQIDKQLAQEAEDRELLELGKKEKQGGFVARARKAEDEVARLTKENEKLRRKIGKE